MKEYSPKNITRIKNISNSETGKAYLDLKEKEFILHFPDKRKSSILDTKIDEMVVLYQRANKNEPRFLTHLVRPIDYEMIEENARENFKFGRIFEVIAYTGEENKINFELTGLGKLDFRNKGWGNAESLDNITNPINIESIQIELWNLFLPFFKNELLQNLTNYRPFLMTSWIKISNQKKGKNCLQNIEFVKEIVN